MAIEFQMPKLGLTMEEGTITAWLVETGTAVEAGTAVLTIETDKVESDVEASHSGILHTFADAGETLECGETIGWFLEPGESPPEPSPSGVAPDAPSNTAAASAGSSTPRSAVHTSTFHGSRLLASPNARRVAGEMGVELVGIAGSGPGGRIVSDDVRSAPMGGTVGNRPPASAAALQTAARLGVDAGEVTPSRSGSRIERSDVERHVRERLAGSPSGGAERIEAAAPTEAPLLQEPTERIPLSGMRGTIAQRMHTALSQMAQLTLTMEVSMDAVVAHRAASTSDPRPGYTDYVVSATARALKQHPVINSQVAQGAVNLLGEVNVGLAVALEGGLVVPVVRSTDKLTFEDLCTETRRLASAAREGALAMEDIEGGTFSVTALGMFGVDAFTPVINPPNTAILGVGRLRDGISWVDGDPRPSKMLTLSLTWDHRAYDGAPAAEFTATVRDHLENWTSQ